MKPLEQLAKTGERSDAWRLSRRGTLFYLHHGDTLMDSSEERRLHEAHAEIACRILLQKRHPRLLIHHIELGQLLESCLQILPKRSTATVCCPEPDLHAWLAIHRFTEKSPLKDPRVIISDESWEKTIRKNTGSYDAVLLRSGNFDFHRLRSGLRKGGRLIIRAFDPLRPHDAKDLQRLGFAVKTHAIYPGAKQRRTQAETVIDAALPWK